MLASTCSIRFFSLALVKFLSRAFTALNLLPSIAATARVNRSSRRHSTMNCAAGRPDRRAVVLPEVGDGLEVRRQARRVSHISSTLRCASRSSRRLEAIWLM